MLKIGIESAILFIASLLSFLFAVSVPNWSRVGMGLCVIFFVSACLVLAITIIKRTKTRVG
jgi:hypothetical protein